eukprot:CAMPEP_0118939874 /NCGR_PEP_ID=MMETSP1169-20130426/30083_1 /TAXON_ID=36882 /ORGANISM="Pyramimonas obovata, Strain CCMP722" /LENGTH=214 /DNA_ID=CAMNT_0006884239 /DNA_START=8 /DNA_END=649 /DNA_ORIENTATION=+
MARVTPQFDEKLRSRHTKRSKTAIACVVGGTALLIAALVILEHYHEDLAVSETGIQRCDGWFHAFNAILMVALAGTNTAINIIVGDALGQDLIEHFIPGRASIKDAVKDLSNNLGLVNALIFASAVALCTNDPAKEACGFISQLYYNVAFNALGASFYGMVSAILPSLYTAALDDRLIEEYIYDRFNMRSFGVAVSSLASSGTLLILAAGMYAW